jgi:hypothetical protein
MRCSGGMRQASIPSQFGRSIKRLSSRKQKAQSFEPGQVPIACPIHTLSNHASVESRHTDFQPSCRGAYEQSWELVENFGKRSDRHKRATMAGTLHDGRGKGKSLAMHYWQPAGNLKIHSSWHRKIFIKIKYLGF